MPVIRRVLSLRDWAIRKSCFLAQFVNQWLLSLSSSWRIVWLYVASVELINDLLIDRSHEATKVTLSLVHDLLLAARSTNGRPIDRFFPIIEALMILQLILTLVDWCIERLITGRVLVSIRRPRQGWSGTIFHIYLLFFGHVVKVQLINMTINVIFGVTITLTHRNIVLEVIHLLTEVTLLNERVASRLQVVLLESACCIQLLDHHKIPNLLRTNAILNHLSYVLKVCQFRWILRKKHFILILIFFLHMRLIS